jgi:hypothetical protein
MSTGRADFEQQAEKAYLDRMAVSFYTVRQDVNSTLSFAIQTHESVMPLGDRRRMHGQLHIPGGVTASLHFQAFNKQVEGKICGRHIAIAAFAIV